MQVDAGRKFETLMGVSCSLIVSFQAENVSGVMAGKPSGLCSGARRPKAWEINNMQSVAHLKPRVHWTTYLIAALGTVLMFWFVQEVRVESRLVQTAAIRRGETWSFLVERTATQTNRLVAEVAALKASLKTPAPHLTSLIHAVDVQTAQAGLTAVTGSGVTVSLEDSPVPAYPGEPAQFQLVHDQYVLHIVGLLLGSGARAISINGQRYVSSTAVFCAGPTIEVNDVYTGSPFVISAVGPSQAMLATLTADPDVQGWSQLVKIHFQKASLVTVPALASLPKFQYARPVLIANGRGG